MNPLMALLLLVVAPADGGTNILFRDTFDADSREAYVLEVEPSGRPDEYGNRPVAGGAGVFHDTREEAFYLEAMDDAAAAIKRDLPLRLTNGTLRVRFIPLAVYPANGRLSVQFKSVKEDSGYTFALAGGQYRVPFAKRVRGEDVLVIQEREPYFTAIHKLGDYDGEMTARWEIQEPREHLLELRFSPGRVEGFFDGLSVREIVDADAVPIVVSRIRIQATQLECLITEIAVLEP